MPEMVKAGSVWTEHWWHLSVWWWWDHLMKVGHNMSEKWWLNVGTSLSGKKKHCVSACLYAHFIQQAWTYSSLGQWVILFTRISSVQIPSLGPGWVLCTHVCSLDLRLCCSLFQTPFLECCAHLSQQAWSEVIYSLQPAGSLSSYDSTVTHT